MRKKVDDEAVANIAKLPLAEVRKLFALVGNMHVAMAHAVDMEKEISQKAVAMATRVSPHTACRNGCNYCCYQAVAISSVEADRISEYSGIPHSKLAAVGDLGEAINSVMSARKEYFQVPCPFLGISGECTIYEVRPIECSLHFNASNTPSLCDTANGLQEVPCIDFTEIHMARSFALYRDNVPVADIREFFDTQEFFKGKVG